MEIIILIQVVRLVDLLENAGQNYTVVRTRNGKILSPISSILGLTYEADYPIDLRTRRCKAILVKSVNRNGFAFLF
jgi:hypothetical protein